MAGERLTDEQCLERLHAFQTFGSFKAASEATGMTRNSIKRGVVLQPLHNVTHRRAPAAGGVSGSK